MKEYNPAIVRNSTRYLLHRPRTTPVDIVALHDICTTASEFIMKSYLNYINYGMPGDPTLCKSVAYAFYPTHRPLTSGYHVIMQHADWCKGMPARYKLVVIYRDRYGNVRVLDCTGRWCTSSTMIKLLSEELERVNRYGKE